MRYAVSRTPAISPLYTSYHDTILYDMHPSLHLLGGRRPAAVGSPLVESLTGTGKA